MAYHTQVALVFQRISIDNLEYFFEQVPGDGNCFFHCLSVVVNGDFSRSIQYRHIVYRTIYNN